MHVCMYVCMYVDMCAYIYACLHPYMHVIYERLNEDNKVMFQNAENDQTCTKKFGPNLFLREI